VHESPVGTERTCRDVRVESAFGGKPDLTIATADFRFCEGFRMPAHDGGARHTGAGIRKPPREETAGRKAIYCVNCYGDFGAGGLLAGCIKRLFGKRLSC